MNPEHSGLEISLSRFDRIYRPGESVSGVLIVTAKDGWSHTGVKMHVAGQASLQVPGENKEVKPRRLMEQDFTLVEPGKMDMGTTKIPFSFVVKGLNKNVLLETYHGAYISVNYFIAAKIERGVMKRGLEKEMEFIVEVPIRKDSLANPKEEPFEITEKTLDNVRTSKVGKIPEFRIEGKLHRSNCLINMPLTGEVKIVKSVKSISSIDVQLVRIESVSAALGSNGELSKGEMIKEATEIESLQIAVGDVARNMVIPIYMVLPRVYTCPSLSTATFAVGFEVNLQIVFEDGYMVCETFGIGLHRVQ
mmetsp:Transcript_16388/g.33738  ORF Transcript_16388/g.33738 Transcript_16388/m.33738 type:complete len:306 (-) Transcript_16388:94-1011(-)